LLATIELRRIFPGIPDNAEARDNFFNEPGTGGLSPLYVVTERLGSATTGTPESIALSNGVITCTATNSCTIGKGGGGGTSVPEPVSLSLLGVGLLGIGAARRKRKA
jgi:hypothetical protein